MASWSTLQAHLVSRWNVAVTNDDWCGLHVEVESDRRSVVIKQSADPTVVIVAVQVCPMGWLSFEEALVYNGIAEHGMLMLEGGVYVLRQLVSLVRNVPEEIDAVIATMAAEAARVRGLIGCARTPADASFTFAHLVD